MPTANIMKMQILIVRIMTLKVTKSQFLLFKGGIVFYFY